MNSTLYHWLLLADIDLFRSLNQQFSGANFRFGWMHVLVGLGILGGISAGVWLLNRLAHREGGQRRYNSPPALFRALCRAHGLSRGNRRLLKQLARHQQLADPARLFLEPERFDTPNLGPALKAQRARLQAIREQLFSY